jgi:hypothetical protein
MRGIVVNILEAEWEKEKIDLKTPHLQLKKIQQQTSEIK